jgi:succinylarginine dihydrolase
MTTTQLIAHSNTQTRRIEKLIAAEHRLIQIEESTKGKNLLFYGQEEQAQWWEKYQRQIEKCKTEIARHKQIYINQMSKIN